MLTRRPPPALMARSLSSVTVSGRPASTVYSHAEATSKCAATASITRESWSAVRVVGVPPPK